MVHGTGWKRLFRIAPDPERDITDELRFHFDSRIEELVAQGSSHAEARAIAVAEFGDVDVVAAALHRIDQRTVALHQRERWISAVIYDIRYAFRALIKQPAFTIAAVVTLALGMAANATMFGIIDRLLLSPPAGVRDSQRIVRMHFKAEFGPQTIVTDASTYPIYSTVRDQATSFDDVAWYMSLNSNIGRGTEARKLRRTLATPSYFSTLGIKSSLGRLYSHAEDRIPAGSPVVVLSYDFWKRDFDGDSGVVGRVLHIGDGDYTVIGVTQPGFTGIDLQASDVFIPMSAGANEMYQGGSPWWQPGVWTGPRTIARLKSGIEPGAAQAEIAALMPRVPGKTKPENAFIRSIIPGRSVPQMPPLSSILARRTRVAQWLGIMSVIVLLIASSNVANLYLTRASRRKRDFAVRLAIGAGRGRLVRQLLSEGMIVSLAGAALGLLIATASGGVLRRVLFSEMSWNAPVVDRRVLLFTLILTVLVTLVTSVLPVLQGSRAGVSGALRTGGRVSVQHTRTRVALLVAQLSLCVVLLVMAGLFVQSLQNAAHARLGWKAENLLTVKLDMRSATPETRRQFWDAALMRTRTLPGVQSAALTNTLPFYASAQQPVSVPGRDSLGIAPDVTIGSPAYIQALGLPVLRGRGFNESDRASSSPVAIVSETFAHRVFGESDPLGSCVIVGEKPVGCARIVGVVPDAQWFGLEEPPTAQLYVPLGQQSYMPADLVLLLRTSLDPASLVAPVRRELARLSTDAGAADIEPMAHLIDPHLQPFRLGAFVFVVFGILALIIAAVGLYGVIAYQVGERMNEFGIRIALGATGLELLRLVLGRTLQICIAGILIGATVAALAAARVKPLLFQTSPFNPLLLAGVAVALLLVAVFAAGGPALRATKADPTRALRAD